MEPIITLIISHVPCIPRVCPKTWSARLIARATVASSNGNKPTESTINGLPGIVGINAYIKPGS